MNTQPQSTSLFAMESSETVGGSELSALSKKIFICYPRKVGKRTALLEIERAIRRLAAGEVGPRMSLPQAFDELMRTTALYAKSPAGQRGIYTPHPSTWFHQSRYLDDPKEWLCAEPPRNNGNGFKPGPMVNALDIKLRQQAEARARGEID